MELEDFAQLAFEAGHAWEPAETFAGRTRVAFDPDVGLAALQPASEAVFFPTFGTPWRAAPASALEKLFYDMRTCEVEALSLGLMSGSHFAGTHHTWSVYELLGTPFLPALRALFLGDITTEEYSATWIHQPAFEGVLEQLPELEVLRVRGDAPPPAALEHVGLRALQLQFHASPRLLWSLAAAEFPHLEMLEVWIGMDNYNEGVTAADLVPLLSGKGLPSLRWLGLKNAERADEVAAAVATSPLLERLEVLDLSEGPLTDAGIEALIASPAIGRLQRLHVDQQAARDEAIERLEGLGIPLLTAQPNPRGPDYGLHRYPSVGE